PCDQDGPDPLHHPVLAPALEPTVDGAVATEVPGETVPLAGGAEGEEDAVERGPPVLGRLSPFGGGLPSRQGGGQDAGRQGVGYLPNGVQGLGLRSLAWHEGILP